ncbi:DUF986 family protein, partial [Salmonella enterica subsp. enterica serovar Anatum]|nr:DUF986 family protein [Salmonella enterica subsp. enterica serovar Anatum]
IFKQRGFFFANVWIEYNRIKEMNLSEDGVLVMQLEQRRLLIREATTVSASPPRLSPARFRNMLAAGWTTTI